MKMNEFIAPGQPVSKLCTMSSYPVCLASAETRPRLVYLSTGLSRRPRAGVITLGTG